MNSSVRFWQKVLIGASLVGFGLSWLTGNWYSGILPLMCAVMGVVSLLSPTPE